MGTVQRTSEDELHQNPDTTGIKTLLARATNIAVVGLSPDASRPSYGVAKALQARGFRIIPVNPNLDGPVLGERPRRSLLDIEDRVDIVDVFRRSEDTLQVAQDAVEVGAGALWMQLGVMNEEAAELAASRGLTVVMDRCLAVEYERLLGES